MKIDSRGAIEYFEKRFHGCDDGVLRRISVIYRSGSSRPGLIELVLSTKDTEKVEGDGFVNLKLSFLSVSEFQLREGNATYQILSEGMKVALLEGRVFATFNPYDYKESPASFRTSEFYIVAKEVAWDILPYRDYEG